MPPARRIGIVDYDLNNFHANTYLKSIRGPLASRGYEITGATAIQSAASADWAEENGVSYHETVEALAPHVDCFAILAPSNPETHLTLCQQVFPFGKPTFVDKTFAPTESIAQDIFTLADQAGVPVQSTSALRTTAVQSAVGKLDSPLLGMNIWAGGASFAEYGVHPVEIAVSSMGSAVKAVTTTGVEANRVIVIAFNDSRTATINFNANAYVPFRAALNTASETQMVDVDDATLFDDAAAAILDFFDAGQPCFPREETLAVMRILDAVNEPGSDGNWVLFD